MAYKQIIGPQGKSKFKLIYWVNRIPENSDVFIIENTAPSISFDPVYPIEKNYRGDNIDPGSKFTVDISLEIINVLEEYPKILKLIQAINAIKMNPNDYTLHMQPLYLDENSFMLPVLLKEGLKFDNALQFINTAQKIQLEFVSKYAITGIPVSATRNIYEVEDIVANLDIVKTV